jgi:hypothetical protein
MSLNGIGWILLDWRHAPPQFVGEVLERGGDRERL